MSEALVSDRPSASARMSLGERKQELTRMLQAKVAQGYRIESATGTEAVLQMGARRRWFGLFGGTKMTYDVAVDEDGRSSSRRRG